MSNVRKLFERPGQGETSEPRPHLWLLPTRVKQDFQRGDFEAALTNFSHARYVAATEEHNLGYAEISVLSNRASSEGIKALKERQGA